MFLLPNLSVNTNGFRFSGFLCVLNNKLESVLRDSISP